MANNSWEYPVDAPITNEYHVSNPDYAAGYHTGVDFGAAAGTPVGAAQKGVVVKAGWGGAYGNYVIIKHPNGTWSLYAHLSAINVHEGQTVDQGFNIGAVGNTGNSDGAHLHFEVRRGSNTYGSDINPLKFFGGETTDVHGNKGEVGTTAGSKKDKLTPEEMAEQYGWAMSFLKTNEELWDLFQKAVKGGWSASMFQAKLRDTEWFQANSETTRKMQLLKQSDPATYQDRLSEIRAQIRDLAGQVGAHLSDKQFDRVARHALMFGWNDSQLRNTVAEYVSRVKGSFTGEAGTNEDELMAYARSMGVRVSPKYVRNAVEKVAAGNWDMNQAKDKVARMAANQFPNLADEIKAGMTVEEAASEYMSTMASVLEINPAKIDLFDHRIRRALSSKNENGKPAMKTIWEFEHDLRKDSAWLKTDNAQDSFMGTARAVLSDLGFAY